MNVDLGVESLTKDNDIKRNLEMLLCIHYHSLKLSNLIKQFKNYNLTLPNKKCVCVEHFNME
jgi:preprotein translocase subunit Sec63